MELRSADPGANVGIDSGLESGMAPGMDGGSDLGLVTVAIDPEWATLLDGIQDGVFVLGWPEPTDSEHLTILYHNEAFERALAVLTGCEPHNLTELPTTLRDVLVPHVHLCRQRQTPIHWQSHLGSRLWEFSLWPKGNPQGVISHVQGVCREVVPRDLFQAVIKHTTDLIVILDAEGECCYVSPALPTLLGYGDPPPQFLLGSPTLHSNDIGPVRHAFHTALAQPEHQITYQCRIRHAQGHWVVMEVSMTNLLGDPAVKGLVVNARDITARGMTEDRLRQQNSYLGALHRASLALLHRQELADVLTIILQEVVSVLAVEDGHLFMVEGDRLVLQVGAGLSQSYRGFSIGPQEGLAGKVWANDDPLVVQNYQEWSGRLPSLDPSWKQSAAAVPLHSGSQVIGVLGVATTDSERQITPIELSALQRFAQLASLAIDNVRLYQSAQWELRQHKQTQEHLAATLRSIGDGVIVTTLEGTIQLMNGMAEHLTGWSQGQAMGQPLSQVLPLVDTTSHAPITSPVEEVIRTQRLVSLRSQSLLRDTNGQERFIAASAAPITSAESINGVVITFRDITQHKLTELSLRQSEARNRAILDALPDLVFRLDRQGRNLDCKGDPEDLVVPLESLMGRLISDLLPPDVAASWMGAIHHTLHTQQMHLFEYALVIRNEERIFEARLIPISLDEVIAIVRNITTLKIQQQQMLYQAERERLLSAISLRIRESLDLEDILHTTVAEVRQFVQADRALIYRFQQPHSGRVIAESVGAGWPSLLGQDIQHEWFAQREHLYRRDSVRHMADVSTQDLPEQLQQHFRQYQVQSVLSLPLFQGDHLWGLLVVHHCQGSRPWTESTIAPLRHLGNQVEIAIQQAHLHQQLQLSNDHLERQVRMRTAQLNKQIQALQLQEQVLGTVQNAILVIHKLGHITYWNRFASTLYGISADAAIGELITDVVPFHPLQAEEILASLQQGQPWSGELSLHLANQKPRVLLIHHTPIHSGTGELMGAISISTDITLRQEFETALRESEARLRTLSETTTAAIFVGQHGHFLDVNPALTQLTGYSRRELLGMSFWHLGDAKYQEAMKEWIQTSDSTSRQEFLIRTHQGEEKWIECTLGAIPYKGNRCYLGTAVDIHHRKQIELQMQQQMQELQQLNLLKDDFLSTVSHELRTPMSNMKLSIHMLTQMMKFPYHESQSTDAVWQERVNRYLNILQDECRREIDLINDLLDLQHLEQGSRSTPYEPIILREVFPTILAPFYSRAQERQQHLHLHIHPQVPEIFWWDRDALVRIFSELLNNACKYAPPQADITLNVHTHGSEIGFSVHNTGSEVPLSEQTKIFDKFYRILANDRWKQGGTGLGLALVKKLVEQHHGRIELESHSQQTAFHIHLPLTTE